jgi:hypothetical protein
MKKQLLLLLACLACIPAQAQPFSNYLHGNNYIFNDTRKILASELFTVHKSEFGLGSDDEMVFHSQAFVPTGADMINEGYLQTSFKQQYKGYEVEGTNMNVLSKCGVALNVSGKILEGLDLDVDNLIDESDALSAVKGHINTSLWFSWEDPHHDDTVRTWDSTYTSFPDGQLIIAPKYNDTDTVTNYALCWKFSITWYDTVEVDSADIDTAMFTKDFYVDATTGVMHTEYDNATGVLGHVQTIYDGYHTNQINTKCGFLCIDYKLVDDERKIETRKFDQNYWPDVPWDNNNNWVESMNHNAATAQWAVRQTHMYYDWHHGNFNSNWTTIYTNASAQLSLGMAASKRDGNKELIYINQIDYSKASLDMLAHEFTHGIIRNTSGSIGYWEQFEESRGLNEGLADIFAMCTEKWYRGWADWTIGEDFMPYFKRNFNDPHNDIPLDHGSYYQVSDYWDDGPYGKSGPVRRWFNHFSQGEWDWPVPYGGAGFDVAERGTYITMMWWVWQTTGYYDFRQQSLAATEYYWGYCSPIWKAAERAWYDVGVGGLTQCKPARLDGKVVAAETDFGLSSSRNDKPRFKIVSNIGKYEPTTVSAIISKQWIIPATWYMSFDVDSTEGVIDSVDTFASDYIYCILTYVDDGDTVRDTLRNVLHFSSECNDSTVGSGPGGGTRFAQTGEKQKQNFIAPVYTKISVYPNPAGKELSIEMPNEAPGDVTIVNLSGQTVFSCKVKAGYNSVKLPVLPNGLYLVHIKNKYTNEVKKIQIQQ